MIPKSDSAKMRNKKEYTAQLGKVICATSLAPLSSGIIAWNGRFGYAMLMLVVGFAVCIWEGTKMIKKHLSDE